MTSLAVCMLPLCFMQGHNYHHCPKDQCLLSLLIARFNGLASDFKRYDTISFRFRQQLIVNNNLMTCMALCSLPSTSTSFDN